MRKTSPYRDPDYADELWTLLLAHWPNIFSPAEQALGNSVTDKHIKTGLWKARTSAAILPPLGWVPLTWKPDEPWGLGWKIARNLGDVKWVHLTGDPGFSDFAPTPQANYVDGVRWEHWCDTPDHPSCPGGYYGGIDHPQWVMDFHRAGYAGPPTGGWHIARFPDMTGVQDSSCYYLYMDYICDWGSSPEDLAWNHHLWDFNTQTTIAGTLTPFAAATGLCGISRSPVPCFTRSLSDADMASRIQVDDFGSYANQAVDLVWPADNSPLYPWNVPAENLDDPRAVLDNEREARDWVNRQLTLKPSLKDPPQVFGLANQGETLIGTQGDWNYATSYSVHWLRCDASGGSCHDFRDPRSYAYSLTADDVGSTMRFKVTAHNASGSATAMSKPSPVVLESLDQLARRYRPVLRFDTDEYWRPLSIATLFSESGSYGIGSGHLSCLYESGIGSYDCPALDGESSLKWNKYNEADRLFIDFEGQLPDGSDYSAPPGSGCLVPNGVPDENGDQVTLRDCNAGARSVMYYEPGQDHNGDRYVDWWYYFRYNRPGGSWIGPIDDHEGDWEGVSLIYDSTLQLLGAIYAQHTKNVAYLPGDLRFEDNHNGVLDCDQDPQQGDDYCVRHQPLVYLANGTHASYSTACSSDCPSPEPYPANGETDHDGRAAWGGNADDDCQINGCTQRFPTSTGANPPEARWPIWPGRWGSTVGEDIGVAEPGWSPESPGVKSRFVCAEVGYEGNNCTRPPFVPLASGRRRRIVADDLDQVDLLGRPTHRVSNPRHCETWFGGDSVVLACDPRLLSGAFSASKMRRPGALHLKVAGHSSDDAPGIAQVVGPVLRTGDRIILRGHPSARTELAVLVRIHDRRYRVVVRHLSLGRAGRATIIVRERGRRPLLALLRSDWHHARRLTVTVTRD